MTGRQMTPQQWLILTEQIQPELWLAIRRLPPGSGILMLGQPSAKEQRRLRHLGALRSLAVVIEARGGAARVHNAGELRRAMLRRTPIILLSPLWPTHSHPEWKPLPRMRAAALARLGGRKLLALGGMDAKRYATVAQLGFIGWAGISAFRI